jgi:hypothetical protein
MGGPKKTLALQYAKQCRCQLEGADSVTRNLLNSNDFVSGERSGTAVRGGMLPIYCAVQRKQRHHPTHGAAVRPELVQGMQRHGRVRNPGANTRVHH